MFRAVIALTLAPETWLRPVSIFRGDRSSVGMQNYDKLPESSVSRLENVCRYLHTCVAVRKQSLAYALSAATLVVVMVVVVMSPGRLHGYRELC
jgi:hypothetical protein